MLQADTYTLVRYVTQILGVQEAPRPWVSATRLQNDDIRLSAEVVVQIATILGVSTDELLGLKETPGKAASSPKNRRLYRRLQDIEKLPRRDQQALLRTIEAFLSKAS